MLINGKQDRADLAYKVFGLLMDDDSLALNQSRMFDMLGGEFDGQDISPEQFVESDKEN